MEIIYNKSTNREINQLNSLNDKTSKINPWNIKQNINKQKGIITQIVDDDDSSTNHKFDSN